MTRTYLLSALVLVFAAAMPACSSDTPDAKTADQPAADTAAPNEGDAFDELKALTDGLQKDVDGLLQPVTDANDAIDRIGTLPKDLKGAKKFDQKKFMKEAAKVAQGQDANVDALGLDADTKAKVSDALDKLKAAVGGLKDLDTKTKAVLDKLTAAATKAPELITKVTAQANLVAKNPLKSADEKKKAQDKLTELNTIKDSFTKKSTDWKTAITDLPTKAKAASDKIAAFATTK
jgi:archaellum component FlaC